MRFSSSFKIKLFSILCVWGGKDEIITLNTYSPHFFELGRCKMEKSYPVRTWKPNTAMLGFSSQRKRPLFLKKHFSKKSVIKHTQQVSLLASSSVQCIGSDQTAGLRLSYHVNHWALLHFLKHKNPLRKKPSHTWTGWILVLVLPMPSIVVTEAPYREQMGIRQALAAWWLQNAKGKHKINYTQWETICWVSVHPAPPIWQVLYNASDIANTFYPQFMPRF